MKKLNLLVFTGLTVLSLVGGTTFAVANTAYASVRASQAPAQVQHYDGETLFRGIVFGQGPVATLFPQIWPTSTRRQANSSQAMLAVDKLMGEMQKENPTYFSQFESAIYSGNPESINSIFTQGSSLVSNSISALKYTSNSTNQTTGTATGNCVTVTIGYALALYTVAGAVNYAVLVNAAGAVNAYLVVFAKTYFWGASTPVAGSTNSSSLGLPVDNNLQKEQFIQQIVNTLG